MWWPDAYEKSSHEDVFAERFPWQKIPIATGDLFKYMVPDQKVTSEQMFDFMTNLYAQFPQQCQAQFAALLRLAEQGATMLFHCTAGKDRTGFASALLLSALNVDDDAIMENYLESSRCTHQLVQTMRRHIPSGELDVFMPVLDVHADYLHAALTSVREHYQDMSNYLRHVLNIDTQRIRQNYLEC